MLSPHYTTPPPKNATPVPRPLVPRPPGGFPRGGAAPFWSFLGGSGREIEIPPRIFLRGSGGVFFQFGKNTSPDAAGHPLLPPVANRPPGRHPQKMAVSVLRPITKKEGADGTFLFLYWRIRPGRGAWLPRRRSGGRGRFRRPSCCASSSGGTWRRRPR